MNGYESEFNKQWKDGETCSVVAANLCFYKIALERQ